jgi:hypothetical protein
MILLAGAVLALSACGGGGSEANEANALATDNMMLDGNLAGDANLMIDQNGTVNAATMGANSAADANTAAAMAKDATTNDPDTNLANGL